MQEKSSKRFKEIMKVLGKYGFKFVSTRGKKSPENLRMAFEELGPTFIKIGQILSSRPDMLPSEFINELSKLQDDVPPEKFEDINNVFFSDFNKNIEECFFKFDEHPFASASIAQVHNAILKDGRHVIVKIQRPNIKEKMETDISILYKIIKFTKNRFEDSIIDPEEALDELKFSTSQELDFNLEAKNMIKFKRLNSNVAFCHVPYLVENLCKNKVITMEKINGFKINNIELLNRDGYDLNDLGKKLATSFFKQVFTDGFFHADPHPGNLLIQENKICFLDFGIMGNLSNYLKTCLNKIIISIVYKDIDTLVSAVMSVGIKKGIVDRNRLYEDIKTLLDNYLSTSLENIKISALITHIFECAKNNNIRLPKDLILLVKSFIIVEGIVSELAPEIQILDVAVPFVKNSSKSYFLDSLNLDDALISYYNFTKNSVKIPTKIVELIDGILNGRAKLQLKFSKMDNSIKQLNKMTNRLSISLISCSMLISSSLILNSNINPKIYTIPLLGFIGITISLTLSLIIIISIIKSGKL
ncbi:MAG: AarF/ABC1/UbiB kinase family protein [Clostridium sp.]|jgi:ubiquinone biosynthesis protein|uniref:ABC1 kinase family protein n=1 Tax=Clostridium sp. TaxID=1506 RepID=UPI0025C4D881|nr:AarF/ABC1/UbiB kinase family protein [Clostridium sp.]MCH3965443.1 AarF/ABC1/UbiB kinase family protein [Clostridium sp.]MCI1717276.1 AarF/ABC1/UbiB kinase family protein [Clostridium sp.]MCI1801616.1 AarF/ABC1/UbiB kinase family protein [Clostridium sp.]MCI1815462.1 AarF/ABC1/UbiB kinase family protein [Clostridium sp.]MCI1872365.1 AarF/ABC1/UbiB kinase family protein [Clostridium sp.]